MQLRVRALETILTEKGYIDPAAIDRIIEAYETKIGPHNGARIIAKAWADPAFKQALLEDASTAIAKYGHVSRVGDHLIAVENTPEVAGSMVTSTACMFASPGTSNASTFGALVGKGRLAEKMWLSP